MIVQFTLLPIGTRTDSLSKALAKAARIVDASGLDYRVGPMGTVVEGEWGEILRLIDRCRKALLKDCRRLQINISVDDRKGTGNARGRITGKVLSLESRSGISLRK